MQENTMNALSIQHVIDELLNQPEPEPVDYRAKYYEMLERAQLAEVELGRLREMFDDLICKLCGERCGPSDKGTHANCEDYEQGRADSEVAL